jgi:hypothetical protein
VNWYRNTCPGNWQDYYRLEHFVVYVLDMDNQLVLSLKPQHQFDPETRDFRFYGLQLGAPCKGSDAIELSPNEFVAAISGNFSIHVYYYHYSTDELVRTTTTAFSGKHPRLFMRADNTLMLLFATQYNAWRFVELSHTGIPQSEPLTYRKAQQTNKLVGYSRKGVSLENFLTTMDYWKAYAGAYI